MKQSVTVGAQLLWSGRYSCNNGRYGCTIVMSYIEVNKAVSQWLLTFNLCVSVIWPLTCAFHIPCTHTPEIIDMHRGMCDNFWGYAIVSGIILCMGSANEKCRYNVISSLIGSAHTQNDSIILGSSAFINIIWATYYQHIITECFDEFYSFRSSVSLKSC